MGTRLSGSNRHDVALRDTGSEPMAEVLDVDEAECVLHAGRMGLVKRGVNGFRSAVVLSQ